MTGHHDEAVQSMILSASIVDPQSRRTDPAHSVGDLLHRYRPELVAAIVGTSGVFAVLPWQAAMFSAGWWLLVLIVIRSDLDTLLIPDTASISIALLGLVQVATTAIANHLSAPACAALLVSSLANAAAAVGFLWAIKISFRYLAGYEGLGLGDVKLLGAVGIWLSLQQQAVVLELAAVAALIAVGALRFRQRCNHDILIPFGAFLAPIAWAVHVIDLLWVAHWEAAP
jgi:leader peptidase (prepilin peptidase) / N-methyltransferase